MTLDEAKKIIKSECYIALDTVIDNETERFNYCPNCGADMRGDEE